MLAMDFVKRLKNPTWWVSVISAIAIIANYFGVDITTYIGQDWKGLIGSIFGFFAILGITVDTSTKGISDQVVAQTTVQAINANSTKEEVTIEATTTAINSTVTENSAGSKITVDNPENIQAIGAVVNPIGASTPQE